MRRLSTPALACSLLVAGCMSSVPPRPGLPGAAVSQSAPGAGFAACGQRLRLPPGWQATPQEGARWRLQAPGGAPLAAFLLCRSRGLEGPGDVLLDPLLGPLDSARMSAEWVAWDGPGPHRAGIAAYRRRVVGVEDELQEAGELPRPQGDRQAVRALLVLRWNPLDPGHVEQRAAVIAALTQSLDAPDAATGITGTHHDQHP
ncbi:hypothetical protein [Stenotrophomonas mori]|nr:hypothetical protein [Stenotrophomonas mori]